MKKLLVALCLALPAGCNSTAAGNPPPHPQASSSHRVTQAVQTPPPTGWQFPYKPNPFVVPICSSDPCSPQLDPNSAAEVSQMMNGSFSMGEIQEAEPGTNGQGQDDTDPLYYATQSDPTYAVTCSQFGGCSFFSGVSVHIPNGAYASIDSDHHATVVERWAGREYDFWEFNDYGTGKGTTNPVSGGGALSVGFGELCTTTSLQNYGRCLGSANEAALPMQPGMLDPREIVAGKIKHTFYAGVYCPSPLYVWPAAQSGGRCATGPAEGERIWLDLTDAAIDALPDNAWAKTLLHQMHDYGFTIDDSAGSRPWVPEGVDNATFTIVGQQPGWDTFFTEVENEGDGDELNWGDNASHLPIPTTGITQSNIHIVE
ncbi:MAG: hypothetical protein JO104_07805 [Candidatus Eremiobacteraeota bacterium]|nr:hypothetical protein [Candidatus Eremiobacteraeota bacterium]